MPMCENNKPRYYVRHDCDKLLLTDINTKIIKKYEHGFDILCNEKIIFFTSDELSLHALSFLIPSHIIETASEGDSVIVSGDEMTVSGNVLRWGDFISRYLFDLKTDYFVLKDNIVNLRKMLKLLGKSSIISEAVLGRSPQESVFFRQECFLRSCDFDSTNVIKYIGVGEGLTPSFDDYLSGVVYVDRVLGKNRIKLDDNFFEAIKSKTTTQSVQQLTYADTGKLSLRFEVFVSDFLTYPITAAQIASLVNFGNTSGTDILCGILAYFESFE